MSLDIVGQKKPECQVRNALFSGKREFAANRNQVFESRLYKQKTACSAVFSCAPTEIRTPVLTLKGLRPGPLDDGGVCFFKRADCIIQLRVGQGKFVYLALYVLPQSTPRPRRKAFGEYLKPKT